MNAPSKKQGTVRRRKLEELAWLCIDTGRARTTKALATVLGVSTATTTRVVGTLRKQLAAEGAELVSVRTPKGFEYRVLNDDVRLRRRNRVFHKRILALLSRKPAGRPPRLKPEDEAIYGSST